MTPGVTLVDTEPYAGREYLLLFNDGTWLLAAVESKYNGMLASDEPAIMLRTSTTVWRFRRLAGHSTDKRRDLVSAIAIDLLPVDEQGILYRWKP